MVISQGDIWWADLRAPTGSEPGFRRPVVIVQGDTFNRSSIGTVVCAAITGNLKWADSPGNVALTARVTGLPRASVVNVTQIVTLNKSELSERAGALPRAKLDLVLAGLDVLLGR